MGTAIGEGGLCTLCVLSPLLLMPSPAHAQVNGKLAYYYVSHWFRSGSLEVKGYHCYQRQRSLFTWHSLYSMY